MQVIDLKKLNEMFENSGLFICKDSAGRYILFHDSNPSKPFMTLTDTEALRKALLCELSPLSLALIERSVYQKVT